MLSSGCERTARSWFGSRYRLHPNKLDDWQSYGGDWEIVNGTIHNNSDERGAKLLTGSTHWSNYTLQADVKLDGNHGDMGVVIRSNDEEEGVDAYNGYYVGLRVGDQSLVVGRSDYGWMEARPVSMPGGVRPAVWYRLKVTAVGCDIAASAQNLLTKQMAWVALTEHPCVNAGRIGLRSLGTGGTWRNISIAPARYQDYEALANHAGKVEEPEYPKREADYNKVFHFSVSANPVLPSAGIGAKFPVDRTRLGDLQDLPRTSRTPIRVRGVVTLTAPHLYIQDASGGALVLGSHLPALNVGDTVEVSGLAQPTLYSAVVRQAKIRYLWSGAPVPPISVTAGQAASGAYTSRFIEVEGLFTGAEHDHPGWNVLNLVEGGQPFKAIYWDPSGKFSRRLQKGSKLQVRGVCVLDREYTQETTPFALLLRSKGDIQVLSGPPWWTPVHVVMLFIGLLALALLAQIIYFRIQQWKTLAITQERDQLAHEVHDTMAQSFAGVGYQIQGIRNSVLRGEGMNSGHIADQLSVTYQLVRRCHEEASRTIAMLGSASTGLKNDLLGELQQTVRWIAGDQVQTTATVYGDAVKLDLHLANALFHIGQEAIANALNHAAPTAISLSLRFEDGGVTLSVADNGCGFDYLPKCAGFGISGMQKRARDIGAELRICSSCGSGTEVIVAARIGRVKLGRRLLSRATLLCKRNPV